MKGEEERLVQAGTLLGAWPDLLDPNFMHSVVMICHHSTDGAYGLVVNQPTELTIAQALPDHSTLSKVELPLHKGGPVDHSTLQFLHAVPEEIPGGMPLAAGIHLGGDLDAAGRFALENPDRSPGLLRFCLGYSGWSAGQLDGELEGRSWIPSPPTQELVFSDEPVAVWRSVVRSIEDEAPGLEDLPPDLSWN